MSVVIPACRKALCVPVWKSTDGVKNCCVSSGTIVLLVEFLAPIEPSKPKSVFLISLKYSTGISLPWYQLGSIIGFILDGKVLEPAVPTN